MPHIPLYPSPSPPKKQIKKKSRQNTIPILHLPPSLYSTPLPSIIAEIPPLMRNCAWDSWLCMLYVMATQSSPILAFDAMPSSTRMCVLPCDYAYALTAKGL
ncbi:unnamed protein product [Periconia digitata]|uniref:Uncharacterized protein n=1 Tax=Periconia digitata TaxID=1303443 RepID=A0A9W4XRF0_9PLEO|nr:unnamed protein product [Periconia digitata]